MSFALWFKRIWCCNCPLKSKGRKDIVQTLSLFLRKRDFLASL